MHKRARPQTAKTSESAQSLGDSSAGGTIRPNVGSADPILLYLRSSLHRDFDGFPVRLFTALRRLGSHGARRAPSPTERDADHQQREEVRKRGRLAPDDPTPARVALSAARRRSAGSGSRVAHATLRTAHAQSEKQTSARAGLAAVASATVPRKI